MIMHTPYASRAVGLLAALVLGGMVLLAGCGGREVPSAPLSSGEASGSAESSAPESTVPDASGEDASDASSASSSAQTDDTRPTGGASSKPGGSTAGGGASTASTRPNNSSSGAASSSTPVTTTTTSRATTAPDGATMAFRQPGDANTLGVWWWNVSQVKTAKADTYLDFCQKNRVSEIYLCIDGMSEAANAKATFADVRAFVKKAAAKGIRVAALTGDYRWINPGNTGFQTYVDKFGAYQKAASKEERFYAMHLDVEPHQHPDFKTGEEGRAKVMQLFADFTLKKAAPAAKAAGTLLEWDIPFWMTDVVKDGEGKDVVLAELMAKTCDTIAIMSYRDTAAKILDVAKEEIAFAKQYGHKVILGVETKSSEGDQVSFMEEGKAVMVEEMAKVHASLKESIPDGNFGLAVHQASVWYSLKD